MCEDKIDNEEYVTWEDLATNLSEIANEMNQVMDELGLLRLDLEKLKKQVASLGVTNEIIH